MRGSGFNSAIDLQLDVESNALYQLHYCLVEVAAEFAYRFQFAYAQYPWILARLTDPRIEADEKTSLAKGFLQSKECCLDRGFSLRLQGAMSDYTDVLPGGKLFPIVATMTFHKIMNIEVEDNFSRAARQRATTQGASDNELLSLFVWLVGCFIYLFVCWLFCLVVPGSFTFLLILRQFYQT